MATRKRSKTPQPITVTTICSECGLGWELHGDDPTTDDCIRLLKIELAKRPTLQLYPQPYPVTFPYQPYRPWVQQPYTITCGTTATGGSNGQSVGYKTPRTIESTCTAVAA